MSYLVLLLVLPAIFLAITVHEYAHGWVADRLGDPTARIHGRLTLNPLRHLDPMGFVCLLLSEGRFGWAKPVPINPGYFRSPRQGMMASSAAGPAANLITAAVCGMFLRVFGPDDGHLVSLLLFLGVQTNVGLAVFNLLPVPPLDGSHILKGLLPPKMAWSLSRYDRALMYGLFGVILLDAVFHTRVVGSVLGGIISEISRFMIGM
jgi:Zn-dependent protease